MVIKTGSDGCLAASRDGLRHIPGYVVDCIDATGAGDAFDAGFIAGLKLGRTVEASAELANAVGALCVTEFGAVNGFRPLQDVETFMTKTPKRLIANVVA